MTPQPWRVAKRTVRVINFVSMVEPKGTCARNCHYDSRQKSEAVGGFNNPRCNRRCPDGRWLGLGYAGTPPDQWAIVTRGKLHTPQRPDARRLLPVRQASSQSTML